MKVLVIIPAYNEEKSIRAVVEKLTAECPEYDYLIVNDCSRDRTEQICWEEGYNYLSLPINLGIGGGIQAGYRYAEYYGYDIAVQHDGDGQHDATYIKTVIDPIVEGKCDIVIGSRFIEEKGFQSSAIRRLGIRWLSGMIKVCSGVRVKDVTSGFRAVNKQYIKFYADEYPQDYPEPEAIIMAKLAGAKIGEVPVIMHERLAGESSIRAWKSVYYMIKVSIAILIRRLTTPLICIGGKNDSNA